MGCRSRGGKSLNYFSTPSREREETVELPSIVPGIRVLFVFLSGDALSECVIDGLPGSMLVEVARS